MTAELRALLAELEEFGRENDRAAADHAARMLNCGPDTGRLLWILCRFGGCRRVLEVGTSNGYSTLWLADAAESVLTIEIDARKRALAEANFRRADLAHRIRLIGGDAGEVLASGLGVFPLVFLDSKRTAYAPWWPALRRAVAPGGCLAVDNVHSHAAECVPLLGLLEQDAEFTVQTLAVGNGVALAYRGGPACA